MPIDMKDNGLVEVDKHKKACLEIVDLINTAASRPKAIWTMKEAAALAQRMGDVAIKSFEA